TTSAASIEAMRPLGSAPLTTRSGATVTVNGRIAGASVGSSARRAAAIGHTRTSPIAPAQIKRLGHLHVAATWSTAVAATAIRTPTTIAYAIQERIIGRTPCCPTSAAREAA